MAIRPAIASLFGLALVAGACSAPSEEVDSTVDIQVTSTTITAELAFVDEADPDATLHLALTKPDTWDPAGLSPTDQNAVVLADLLHDGLTEATGTILRPALANSWTSDTEFQKWTFVLDTDRVKADEVVASFERLRSLAPNSAAVQLLGSVASIEADDDAVVFTLTESNAGFPWILSGVQYSIVLEDGRSSRYEVSKDDAGGMTLTSDRLPDIDISWFDDGKATAYQLTLGNVDAAVVGSGEAREAATRFGQQPSARSIVRFYGLNLASEDLKDSQVREAVLLSIDRPSVLDEMPVAGFNADGTAGPATAGYRYAACDLACIYNPETSRSLLREAGVKPTISIVYVGDDQQQVAQEIAANLRKGGFRTEVEEVTASELPTMIADGTADIFSYGWTAPGPSMDSVVAPLLGSDSPMNAFGYASPVVDALLAEAAVTLEDVERWDLLDEAHRTALADWIVIPVAVAHHGLVQSSDIAPLALRADGSFDVVSIR